MTDFLAKLNPVQRATMVWLVLMFATVSAALVSILAVSGVILLVVSLAILMLKGQLIIDYFMDLQHVAVHWRVIMSAYCIVISLFVLLSYGLSI